MLTDLTHIIKVKFQDPLQLKFVLEVVYHTSRIANSSLLVDGTTYEVLVNVVFQPDSRDIVDVVEGLLD